MPCTYIPLFLDYKFAIPCKHGFTVSVTMKGRVLVEDDGAEQWVYRVNPGGINAMVSSSDDLSKALAAFNRKLRLVIEDLAEVVKTPDEFKTEMRQMFSTNEPYYEVWHKAIAVVRNGRVSVENLQREQAETAPQLSMQEVAPSDQAPTTLESNAKVASEAA